MRKDPKSKSGIVADGRKRAREGAREDVRGEVEREYAEALRRASLLRRVFLRWRMKKEIRRRLDETAPPEALY